MSFCLFVMVVRSEVVLSPKIISENFDFALVFSIFLTIVVLLHLNLRLSKRLEISGPMILRDLYFPSFPQLDFVCAISETLGFLLCPMSPTIVWSAFFCLWFCCFEIRRDKTSFENIVSGLRLIFVGWIMFTEVVWLKFMQFDWFCGFLIARGLTVCEQILSEPEFGCQFANESLRIVWYV